MAAREILVIGAGSWGTALALVLARNGHDVYIWDIVKEHIEEINRSGENARYLPGVEFPSNLRAIDDISQCATVEDVVMAMPCAGLTASLELLKTTLENTSPRICLACKGFEPTSNSLNSLVAEKALGSRELAVISGPSFAGEVAAGLPTAITIASANEATADHFSGLFHSERFRTYTNDDVIGVQVGGAVKNVIAIAAGIADGLGYGANTRSALMTRSLAEIMRLGIALGGRRETFMGLAGLGDLILTCTDNQSRNRRFGLALAKGMSIEEAKQEIGQAIEGIVTTSVVFELAREHDVDMPVTEQVHNILQSRCSAEEAVLNLLAREAKSEI